MKTNMFTITHNFAPAHPLLCPRPGEECQTGQSEKNERIDKPLEPETRLWKLTAEVVQSKRVRSELLVLLFFLTVVVSAGVVSVQELARLIRSNAIEHVAAKALQS